MPNTSKPINQWFRGLGYTIITRRWLILITVTSIAIACAAGLPKIHVDSSYNSWFLEDDPVLQATEDFIETFGNDNFVAILVKADDVFAPDILRMIRRLGNELLEQVPYADEIISLTNFEFTRGTADSIEILNIVPDDIPDNPDAIESIRELAFSKPFWVNRLFSEDSTEAWIILRLRPYSGHVTRIGRVNSSDTSHSDASYKDAAPPHDQVAQAVKDILAQDAYQDYTLLSAGNPIREYEQRVFVIGESVRMIGLAFLVSVIILFAALRSFRDVAAAMLVCLCTLIIIFGIMGWLDMTIDSIVVTLPIYLALALAVGYSIHIFNFFNRTFQTTGKRREAVIHAVEHTGWPMFFTSLTTIGGMIAFYIVPVQLIRWEGFACTTSIAAVYLVIMLLLPALLSFGKDRVPQENIDQFHTNHRKFDRLFTRFSNWVQAHPLHILLTFSILVILGIVGITRMDVNVDYARTLGIKVPYVKQFYEVSKSQVGAYLSYDVTLTFETPDQAKRPEILKNLDILATDIQRFPLVKRTSSLVDVVKDLNQAVHADNAEYYWIPDEQNTLAQLLFLYEIAGGDEARHWVDYEYRTLRLMVEITDFNTAEVERELRQIEQWTAKLFPQATFGMAGGVVKVSVAQNYIAKGEIQVFLIAIVIIGILMMLVFRSVKTGLIAMIPNIAPALMVGGVMGFTNIPLDMMTMVVIPMLLGLAVDDTIHFITRCQQEFQRSGTYAVAIHNTFQTVGVAIFMTSFILILAFATYLTSIANVFFNLGLLVIMGVFSASAADYFVTPVLLHWAKPFGPERKRSITQTEVVDTRNRN